MPMPNAGVPASPRRSPKAWRPLLGLLALVASALVATAGMQWHQRSSQARLGDEVARLAKPGDIRMIASVDCVYCAAATRWFNANRVPFTSCEIERDAACAEAYAALRAPGTPVMLVRSQRLVGFDATAIAAVLREPLSTSASARPVQ